MGALFCTGVHLSYLHSNTKMSAILSRPMSCNTWACSTRKGIGIGMVKCFCSHVYTHRLSWTQKLRQSKAQSTAQWGVLVGSKDSRAWRCKERCLTLSLVEGLSRGEAFLKSILPPTMLKKPFFFGL